MKAPILRRAIRAQPYQEAVLGWRGKSFLLADQQGLGKTLEALANVLATSNRGYHLILAPSVAVLSVWKPEIERWLAGTPSVVVSLTGSLKARQRSILALDSEPPAADHVFVVANIESARIKPCWDEGKPRTAKAARYKAENAVLPGLFTREWDTVIVDECQRALIRSTGTLTQTRAGFNLLAKISKRRVALSGTPMRGKPEQLWGTLHWLQPDVYTSYWKWVKRYFYLESNGFSQYLVAGLKPDGAERMAADLADVMLRRTKAEVLTDLPPKTYAGTLLDPADAHSPFGVWLDPTPAQIKQLAEADEDGVLSFPDGEVMLDNALSTYTRLKQLSNAVHTFDGLLRPTLDSPKYEWLLNWLAQADGAPVVVASQFTSLINVFAKGLRDEGYNVCVLTGQTPAKARAKMVEDFQKGTGAQVFMLNTKAGGVALTLDVADYLVLLDETTVPDDQEQVEDRIHRASRNHNVTIYYLRTRDTLDEEVAWIAAAREDVQKYLLDGARGIEYAKNLYHQRSTT